MQREPLDLTTPSPSTPMTDSSMDSDQQFNFVSEPNPSTFSLSKSTAGANGTSTRRCQVCNGNSSGYHFGATTCEACKVFFMRSLERKKAVKPCKKDGKCSENHPVGKISCASCRYQKCLDVGMAKEGVKLGRTSYERKSEETKQLQQLKAKQEVLNSFDSHVIELATLLSDNFNSKIHSFQADMGMIEHKAAKLLEQYNITDPSHLTTCLYSPGENADSDLHEKYTLYRKLISDQQPCSHEMLHTLEIDTAAFHVWCKSMEKIYLQLLNYAKSIPGFSELIMEDKIILMKSSRCELLQVIRHKTHLKVSGLQVVVHYHADTGDMVLFPSRIITTIIGEGFHDFHMKFMIRITNLRLTGEDIAILGAFVIMTPERDSLQCPQQVQELQDKLLKVLEYVLVKNHPNRKNMLAEVLLFMPMLREYTERVYKTAPDVARMMGPDASPLLYDLAKC